MLCGCKPGIQWDHVFAVVYYKNGRLSVNLLLQKRKPAGQIDPMQLQLEFLETHNRYRNLHGVPALELDEELCEYAQEWANTLAVANGLQYRKRPRYGENIICIYSSDPNYIVPGRFPVDIWYEEKNDYHFGEEPTSFKTAHFTQIVWKSSRKLGLGWAKSKEGYYYIVANYHPGGNRAGEYADNVPPVRSAGGQRLPEDDLSETRRRLPDTFDEVRPPIPLPFSEQRESERVEDAGAVKPLIHLPPPEPSGTRPQMRRLEDPLDDIAEVRNKAEEIIETIENMEKDTRNVPAAIKVLKDVAGDVVAAIEQIRADTEHVKDVPDLSETRTVVDDMWQTLQDMENISGDDDVFEPPDEAELEAARVRDRERKRAVEDAKQKVDKMKHAVDELEVERERTVHIPEVVNLAHDTAEQIREIITDVGAKKEDNQDISSELEKAKQVARDLATAVKIIGEDKEHAKQIPDAVDKVKETVGEVAQAIEKMKVGEEYVKDMRPVVDEAEQKAQQITEAIDKIDKDKEMDVLRHISLDRHPREDFFRQCLDAHNGHRRNHDVPPLTLDDKLCKISQAWANELGKMEVLKPNPDIMYGENIYFVEDEAPNFTIPGDEPVDSWYEEVDRYKFGSEPLKIFEQGHFTQVVWKNSKRLGIGTVKSGNRIIVVCNYYPPGNIDGQFAKMVPPYGGFMQDPNKLPFTSRDPFIFIEDDFKGKFLKAHNKYRKRHGAAALTLDENICDAAQQWANALARWERLQLDKKSPYGANLYAIFSSDPHYEFTAQVPVESWYNERKAHDFLEEVDILKSGHFCQLVWKRTRSLGVGYAKGPNGYIYLVAYYNPPGNIKGEYTKNVFDIVDEKVRAALEKGQPIEESETELEYVPSVHSIDKYVSDGVYTPFQLHCLDVHNEYRKLHGVPPLKLNKHLCDFARDWAEQNLRAGKMYHRPNNEFGENIYTMTSSDYTRVPSAREAVKSWYDEIGEYVFDSEEPRYGSLHFTQAIWRNTKEMGADIARNDKGSAYIVANYKPRGNVKTQFTANVPRPLEGRYSLKQR